MNIKHDDILTSTSATRIERERERETQLNPIEWSSSRVINGLSRVWLVNYSLAAL